MRIASSPGLWPPSGLWPRWARAARLSGGGRVGEQMPGGVTACGRSRRAISCGGGRRWPSWRRTPAALGGLRRLAQAPTAAMPSPLGDWPWRTVRSEPRTVGVSPAQEASLRAEPNRLMSPISARRTSAVNGPTPGSWVRTLTAGRTWPAGAPPSRAGRPGRCRASTAPGRPRSPRARPPAAPARPAIPARAAPAARGRPWPWSARTAWIRLRSSVRSRTSCARCRSSARSCRTAGGAIHASGSRSARSS